VATDVGHTDEDLRDDHSTDHEWTFPLNKRLEAAPKRWFVRRPDIDIGIGGKWRRHAARKSGAR
jgi:hypothetical protein